MPTIELHQPTATAPFPHYVVHGRVVVSKTWLYEATAAKLSDERRAQLKDAIIVRRLKNLDLLREFPELPGLLGAFDVAEELDR